MAKQVIFDDDPNGQRLEEWLQSIADDAAEACEEVAKEVTEVAMDAVIKELKQIHESRTDDGESPHPPLYTEVTKSHRRKKKHFRIQGGKSTRSLWHIVNDGTYRTRPRRFMMAGMEAADGAIDGAWEKQRRRLGE